MRRVIFAAIVFLILGWRCAERHRVYFQYGEEVKPIGRVGDGNINFLWVRSLLAAPGKDFEVFDGSIVVSDLRNRLYLINEMGKIVKSIRLKGSVNGKVLINGEYAYFTTSGDRFRLIKLSLRNTRDKIEKKVRSVFEPVLVDSLLLVVSMDGKVYCMSKENLGVMWIRKLKNRVYFAPFSVDGMVYIIDFRGRLFPVEIPSGKLRKATDLPTMPETVLPVDDTLIVFGGRDGKLLLYNVTENRIRWMVKLHGRIVSKPLLKNGMLIVGTMADSIYMVDFKKGKVLDRIYIGEPVSTDMVGVGTVAIFGSLSRKLICFDIIKKQVVWKCKLKGRVISNPLLFGDFLVVGCEYKYVYLFELR